MMYFMVTMSIFNNVPSFRQAESVGEAEFFECWETTGSDMFAAHAVQITREEYVIGVKAQFPLVTKEALIKYHGLTEADFS